MSMPPPPVWPAQEIDIQTPFHDPTIEDLSPIQLQDTMRQEEGLEISGMDNLNTGQRRNRGDRILEVMQVDWRITRDNKLHKWKEHRGKHTRC